MASMTQSIDIHASPEKVEQFYLNFAAYPSYIAPIASLKDRGDGHLECSLRVAGFEFPYVAHWQQTGPGTYSWQTVEGSISHRGTARIEPIAGGTRVTLDVQYDPPGGEWGKRISNWLGLADTGLRHALESFKARVEAH